MQDLALGIDVGTSGVRVAAVDVEGKVAAFAATTLPPALKAGALVTQDSIQWWDATRRALRGLKVDLGRVGAVAVDGTSGTILGIDANGRALTPGDMYNSEATIETARRIAAVAPPDTIAIGRSSALARAIDLQSKHEIIRLVHQADWISGQLSGRFDVTDENNALKTGYDPIARQWPDWIARAGMRLECLPSVVEAGAVIGEIARPRAVELGLGTNVLIVAGTTDGCAAFLATGARRRGEAVTSLGTTLVLKILSSVPLFVPGFGVYSHRIGDAWLVGGASNSGAAVLERYFSVDQIRDLSEKMLANVPTGLSYYPLPGRGERFPVCDPAMESQLEPRPGDDVMFLQALMEGITSIEQRGYRLLTASGAPTVASIRTVGGGSKNATWRTIRERMLDAPLVEPLDTEAAVGVARLARTAL